MVTFLPNSDDLSNSDCACIEFIVTLPLLPSAADTAASPEAAFCCCNNVCSSNCLYKSDRNSFCFFRAPNCCNLRCVFLYRALAALISCGVNGGSSFFFAFFFLEEGNISKEPELDMPANCSRSSGDRSDNISSCCPSPLCLCPSALFISFSAAPSLSGIIWPFSARPRFQVSSDRFNIPSKRCFSLSSLFDLSPFVM